MDEGKEFLYEPSIDTYFRPAHAHDINFATKPQTLAEYQWPYGVAPGQDYASLTMRSYHEEDCGILIVKDTGTLAVLRTWCEYHLWKPGA